MPGVLKTDCRVKPEVKSFNRLETKLAGSFHFIIAQLRSFGSKRVGKKARNFDPSDQNALKMEPSCTGGGNVTTEEGS